MTPEELADGQMQTWGYYDGVLSGILRRDGKLFYFELHDDCDFDGERVYDLRELGPVVGTIAEIELNDDYQETGWPSKVNGD